MPSHHFATLPDELLVHIFSFLSHTELDALFNTCRRFRSILSDDLLWKSTLAKYFRVDPAIPIRRLCPSRWVDEYRRRLSLRFLIRSATLHATSVDTKLGCITTLAAHVRPDRSQASWLAAPHLHSGDPPHPSRHVQKFKALASMPHLDALWDFPDATPHTPAHPAPSASRLQDAFREYTQHIGGHAICSHTISIVAGCKFSGNHRLLAVHYDVSVPTTQSPANALSSGLASSPPAASRPPSRHALLYAPISTSHMQSAMRSAPFSAHRPKLVELVNLDPSAQHLDDYPPSWLPPSSQHSGEASKPSSILPFMGVSVSRDSHQSYWWTDLSAKSIEVKTKRPQREAFTTAVGFLPPTALCRIKDCKYCACFDSDKPFSFDPLLIFGDEWGFIHVENTHKARTFTVGSHLTRAPRSAANISLAPAEPYTRDGSGPDARISVTNPAVSRIAAVRHSVILYGDQSGGVSVSFWPGGTEHQSYRHTRIQLYLPVAWDLLEAKSFEQAQQRIQEHNEWRATQQFWEESDLKLRQSEQERVLNAETDLPATLRGWLQQHASKLTFFHAPFGFENNSAPVQHLFAHSDGSFFLAGTASSLSVWDTEASLPLYFLSSFSEDRNAYRGVLHKTSNHRLINVEDTVSFVNPDSLGPREASAGSRDALQYSAVEADLDYGYIVAGDASGIIRVWQLPNMESDAADAPHFCPVMRKRSQTPQTLSPQFLLARRGMRITALAVDAMKIASGDAQGSVALWDRLTGALLRVIDARVVHGVAGVPLEPVLHDDFFDANAWTNRCTAIFMDGLDLAVAVRDHVKTYFFTLGVHEKPAPKHNQTQHSLGHLREAKGGTRRGKKLNRLDLEEAEDELSSFYDDAHHKNQLIARAKELNAMYGMSEEEAAALSRALSESAVASAADPNDIASILTEEELLLYTMQLSAQEEQSALHTELSDADIARLLAHAETATDTPPPSEQQSAATALSPAAPSSSSLASPARRSYSAVASSPSPPPPPLPASRQRSGSGQPPHGASRGQQQSAPRSHYQRDFLPASDFVTSDEEEAQLLLALTLSERDQ